MAVRNSAASCCRSSNVQPRVAGSREGCSGVRCASWLTRFGSCKSESSAVGTTLQHRVCRAVISAICQKPEAMSDKDRSLQPHLRRGFSRRLLRLGLIGPRGLVKPRPLGFLEDVCLQKGHTLFGAPSRGIYLGLTVTTAPLFHHHFVLLEAWCDELLNSAHDLWVLTV